MEKITKESDSKETLINYSGKKKGGGGRRREEGRGVGVPFVVYLF